MSMPRRLLLTATAVVLVSVVALSGVYHRNEQPRVVSDTKQSFQFVQFNTALAFYVSSEKIEGIYTSQKAAGVPGAKTGNDGGDLHLNTLRMFVWMCNEYNELTPLLKDRAEEEASKTMLKDVFEQNDLPADQKLREKLKEVADAVKTRYGATLKNINAACEK